MQPNTFQERHRKLFVGLIIALVCVSQTYFVAMPAYVQMTAHDWGFSESQLGFFSGAEVAGGTLGSLLVSSILARLPMRHLIGASMLLLIVGNGGLTSSQPFEVAMLVRAISGVGTGIIMSATLKYLASSGTYLSWSTVVQGVYTLIVQAALLPLLPSAGWAYGLIALLAVVFVPAALIFAKGESMVGESLAIGREVNLRGAYITLVSLFMLYVGCGVIWTFAENLGASGGLDEQTMNTILGSGPILSLGICLFIPRLIAKGHRFATTMTLLIGCAASALALVLLPVNFWSFAVGTFVFFTCWTGALILIYATIAAYDGVGRHVAMSTAFLGVGYVIGSSLGGVLIEHASLQVAFTVAAAFSVVSTVLYALLRKVPHPEVLDDVTPVSAQDLIATPEPHFRP